MRLLIQRVLSASVKIDNTLHSEIGPGMLIFIGIHKEDDSSQIPWLAQKCVDLRMFEDESQKLNRSIREIQGEILVVSQFTLYGSCLKGKRPEFTKAASGMNARVLYQKFIEEISSLYPKIKTGQFGAEMKVELINDGPVTLIIDK